MLQQRLQQTLVIQDGIAALGIGEQTSDAVSVARFAAEVGDNEVNVRRRKLHPAIRLNHFHGAFLFIGCSPSNSSSTSIERRDQLHFLLTDDTRNWNSALQ